ncbi:39S mitochondrial ribosomal protein L46-domain-containing protein [Crassisporium funariophilum]|nr:39S mitochondrial ribosomal protein L46-domain-containing protein [Crassisporium funariophilum]
MLSRPSSSRARVQLRTLVTEAASAATLTRAKKPPPTHISTAIILNRSPILTRTPTQFEQAFYSYQSRIRRSLHNPFPYDFYFKQGSLLETRFNMEERKRERLAFGPSFLIEEEVSEEKKAANKAAVEQLALQEGEGEELMPRVHPSDTSGDFKSLDRRGKRNLYLLLQTIEDGKDVWRFPQGDVEKGQLLHQAAYKDLYAECGDEMDTWIVGRKPIGIYKPPPRPQDQAQERVVFFFKGHIMAGQVKPSGESVKDFAWLTKEEIEKQVDQVYWDSIKDILSDY